MSNKKGRSFNDRMMQLVGVPVVLCWMGFACLVIWFGLHDDKVLNNIDGYTTLIAIIGGPALLILTSILELWTREQNQEITSMPEHWTARQREAEAETAHLRALAVRQEEHIQRLEAEKQKVELGLIQGTPSESESEE
jgi:hypothetical protein